jgi:hypothetical protein
MGTVVCDVDPSRRLLGRPPPDRGALLHAWMFASWSRRRRGPHRWSPTCPTASPLTQPPSPAHDFRSPAPPRYLDRPERAPDNTCRQDRRCIPHVPVEGARDGEQPDVGHDAGPRPICRSRAVPFCADDAPGEACAARAICAAQHTALDAAIGAREVVDPSGTPRVGACLVLSSSSVRSSPRRDRS